MVLVWCSGLSVFEVQGIRANLLVQRAHANGLSDHDRACLSSTAQSKQSLGRKGAEIVGFGPETARLAPRGRTCETTLRDTVSIKVNNVPHECAAPAIVSSKPILR